MRAKSTVDRRSKTIVFGSVALLLAIAVLLTLTVRLALSQLLIGYGSVILASSFLLWLLYGTFYELRDGCLYCRSGPFVERIGYDSIRYLGYSEGMRIEIRQLDIRPIRRFATRGQGIGLVTMTTMIAPENLEIFMAYLKQRCHYLDKAS
jgi:hypothetical protein